MAGHPQEPAWQPPAQDQARSAWQPSYTPPAGSQHDSTYAFPQPGQQGMPGQPGQPGQGYPPPTYPPQGGQSQGAPQWQAIAGLTAAGQARGAKVRAPGEKGFIGSLFDFSFTSMVTPKIIKVLYALFTAWTALWALIFIRFGFHYGAVAGIFILVIVVPIFLLLTLGAYRVVLEAFMVLHRIHEELKTIRANGEQQQG